MTTLVLGVGNVLLGDEGVGVHVARALETRTLPSGVDVVDGGTGGFHLLGMLQAASRAILVDATLDGSPPGTVRVTRPRYAADYPPSLSAHDIGLKDLIDALYLLGSAPDVVLVTISVPGVRNVGLGLSNQVEAAIPAAIAAVLDALGESPRE